MLAKWSISYAFFTKCYHMQSLCTYSKIKLYRLWYAFKNIPDTPLVISPPLCRVLFPILKPNRKEHVKSA